MENIVMEYKKITAGFFDKEINFCIYNLPNKQVDNIPYSLLLTENIIFLLSEKKKYFVMSNFSKFIEIFL